MPQAIQNHKYLPITDFDFANLCALLSDAKYTLAVAKIKILATTLVTQSFPLTTNSYTRNVIIHNQHQWLGLINWDKDAKTRIHGHPDRTFVYVIRGRLKVQNFDSNPLLKRDSNTLSANEYRHSNGVKGRMDNFVHQVCAVDKSLSLHFYSGDPTRGDIFDV